MTDSESRLWNGSKYQTICDGHHHLITDVPRTSHFNRARPLDAHQPRRLQDHYAPV